MTTGVGGLILGCTVGLPETGGLGCVLAIEAAPAFIYGGYKLTRGGLDELEEMYIKNKEDCQ